MSDTIPPLGLTPKFIHEQHRMDAIIRAFHRYTIARKIIPDEWIEEFKELNSRIKT